MTSIRPERRMIDIDGHIIEPPDVWERYIETRWRDQAIRVRRDNDGMNRWLVRGKPSRVFPALLPCTPGMNDYLAGLSSTERGRELMKLLYRDYLGDSPAGSADPDARVRVMREQGLDAVLLFPTLGLSWEEEVLDDPEYTYAHIRAYNSWITEFCQAAPGRLLPVAQISFLDMNAAVSEIKRVADRGAKGVIFRPGAVDDRAPSHRHFDPIWAAIQDHDLSLGLHVMAPQRTLFNWGRLSRRSMFAKVHDSFPIILGIVDMIVGGVLDRFPRLRVAPLEVGAIWAEWILAEMNAKMRHPATSSKTSKLSPFELFERNCWITPHPREDLGELVEIVGDNKLMTYTDYPHPEADADMPGLWRDRVSSMDDQAAHRLLRGNALDYLNIDDPGPLV